MKYKEDKSESINSLAKFYLTRFYKPSRKEAFKRAKLVCKFSTFMNKHRKKKNKR